MNLGDGLMTHGCPLVWILFRILEYGRTLGAIGPTCNADSAPSTGFSRNAGKAKRPGDCSPGLAHSNKKMAGRVARFALPGHDRI
jgi:hypothetical protein